MNAELINGWWMTTDSGGQMGTTNTSNISDKQRQNAQKIHQYFKNLGWSESAIAGMIGNMQLESWLSPALIQGTNRWRLPNSAASLSDVPNEVMINFYKEYYGATNRAFGVGIVQWDGKTDTSPAGQKLVSFAMRNGLNWYDGNTQMYRIQREKETNIQWTSYQINGIRWTWDNYPTNDQTPEVSAHVWQACYESSDPGTLETRQENARYWFDYFAGNPGFIPGDWFYYLFSNRKRGLKNVRRNYSRKL